MTVKFTNFLQAKLNVDKVRFEWGGCIYAGWVVACLEICTAGGMWHFRGFAPERRQEKDNEIQENLLSKWVNGYINSTITAQLVFLLEFEWEHFEGQTGVILAIFDHFRGITKAESQKLIGAISRTDIQFDGTHTIYNLFNVIVWIWHMISYIRQQIMNFNFWLISSMKK